MSELTKEQLDSVYEVIEVAKATGKIKKGCNEATKAIEKGTAKLVAYAKDANPAEIVMHIPLLAKEKGIACFAVSTKEELGTAAGLVVPTVAVAVTEEGNAKKLLKDLLGGNEAPAKKEAPAKEEKKEEAPAKEEKAEEPAKEEAPAKEEKTEEPAAEEKKEEAPKAESKE